MKDFILLGTDKLSNPNFRKVTWIIHKIISESKKKFADYLTKPTVDDNNSCYQLQKLIWMEIPTKMEIFKNVFE